MRLLLCVGLCLALATGAQYQGHKTYRLTPNSSQLDLLKRFENAHGYDIWTRGRVPNAPLDIMVAPEEQTNFETFLVENLIAYEVLVPDVQRAIDEETRRQRTATRSSGEPFCFVEYHDHPEINTFLDEMAAMYPNVASVEVIGKSTEGRELKVLRISRAGPGGGNPIIWIDAGIHAREWIAPAMALYVINQLLENPDNSALLDGVDWHILPVVNPDGYQWSHTKDRMWRKTRSRTRSQKCRGVDANRNWDLHWSGKGSSGKPCHETFYGSRPFSEPETAAVRDYLLANAADIELYLTLHSYGNYFLYPWGWTSELPDNWQAMEKLAHEADAAQQAAGGAPYAIGSSTNLLGEGAGGSDDWALGVARIPLVYTVELPGGGATGFDLPASDIEKTVSQFFPAIVVFGEHVRDKASERHYRAREMWAWN